MPRKSHSAHDGSTSGTDAPAPKRGSTGPGLLDGPAVESARRAEQRLYDHYGVSFVEHVVDVDDLGRRVRVAEVGSGPPLVLVTGGTGVGLEWVPLLPELAEYTCYVVDRPGGGFSEAIDHRAHGFREQAISTTRAVYDHFDLERAPLVGNSIGGHWAIRFAQGSPERVPCIAMPGCPAFYPGTSAPLPMRLGSLPVVGGVLFDRAIRADDAAGARANWEFLGQSSETVRTLPEAFADAWYRAQNLPNAKLAWVSLLQAALTLRGARRTVALTRADLRDVSVPVSLLWGRVDPFGSVEDGRRGATAFPDAEFHVVGDGHLPWLDDPAGCGALIREFVDGHS